MPEKSFERTLPFSPGPNPRGGTRWLPIVPITIFAADGSKVSVPLLFDTGAEVTYLRRDFYYLFGVPSWDRGQPVPIGSVGTDTDQEGHLFQATVEVFGKTLDCPIVLTRLPEDAMFVGLFGRLMLYEHFGFGFWEGVREILATVNP